MVFNTAVAIGKGERADQAVIEGLRQLDPSVASAVKLADEVIFALASGQNVAAGAYKAIRDQLPPEAQLGMDYARRIANGENIPDMALTDAEQAVVTVLRADAQYYLNEAKDQDAGAMTAAAARVDSMFNHYAIQFGYQMAVDRLSSEARGAIHLGFVGGVAVNAAQGQFVGTFGSAPETNIAKNDSYETMGKSLIASGIKYKNRPVSDILKGSKFSIVIDFYDSLNRVWTKRMMRYNITDAWRRGFTIAIGVCQGSSRRGPGQLAVYQTLAEDGGRAGFDAGQAVQYDRTLGGDLGFVPTETIVISRSKLITPNHANMVSMNSGVRHRL